MPGSSRSHTEHMPAKGKRKRAGWRAARDTRLNFSVQGYTLDKCFARVQAASADVDASEDDEKLSLEELRNFVITLTRRSCSVINIVIAHRKMFHFFIERQE